LNEGFVTITSRIGDCRDVLRTMPDESVHCVVTSPPYFGLRDYGTAQWEGGDAVCDHVGPPMRTNNKPSDPSSNFHGGSTRANEPMGRLCTKCGATRTDSQLGLEPTPDAYVAAMVGVFREVRRVLRKDGTVWLNLGDSYSGSPKGNPGVRGNINGGKRDGYGNDIGSIALDKSRIPGLKPKDLIGIPWRVAFALQADGWYLRQDIIWAKPNPMPESVTDRCTKSHEYIFLLSRSERYFYDAAAIAEPVTQSTVDRLGQPTLDQQIGSDRVPGKTNGNMKAVPPRFGGAKYGDSADKFHQTKSGNEYELKDGRRNKRSVWTIASQPFSEAHFATFPPALIEPCIKAGCPAGGIVLDPFGGAGTTGLVADRLGRNAILIELNPAYASMAEDRVREDAGMFAQFITAESLP
jgi:DNA modification methylase